MTTFRRIKANENSTNLCIVLMPPPSPVLTCPSNISLCKPVRSCSVLLVRRMDRLWDLRFCLAWREAALLPLSTGIPTHRLPTFLCETVKEEAKYMVKMISHISSELFQRSLHKAIPIHTKSVFLSQYGQRLWYILLPLEMFRYTYPTCKQYLSYSHSYLYSSQGHRHWFKEDILRTLSMSDRYWSHHKINGIAKTLD